jgi:glycosyltransferase involved in cell wall biosynthesis
MGNGRPMRVLLAGASLEPDWQGGEPVVLDLLRAEFPKLGVEVIENGTRRSFGELVALSLSPYDAELSRVRSYRRYLREEKPDAVLMFYDFDCSWVVAARKEGIPVVPCIQIYWPTCPVGTHYIEGVGTCPGPELAKCLRHMARAEPSPNLGLPVPGLPAPLGFALYAKLWTRPAALNQADRIVAVSEFTRRTLARSGYTNVQTIHDSVDVELFRERPWQGGSKVVLYPVARSGQERKGYPHFVRLATEVKREMPDVRFMVLNHVGDALLEGTPYLSRAELAERLASVYLAVLPGLWDEPFGLVTVEAMAAGRPVVAYDGGAMSEIIENGVSGIIVPRGDVGALRAAVVDLLNDEAKAHRIGRAARLRVEEKFTSAQMAKKYLALLESLVDGRSRGTPRTPDRPLVGETGRAS